VPKYYDKLLRREDRDAVEEIKKKRLTKASEAHTLWNNTVERRKIRGKVAEAKLKLKRKEI
jgi:hypothetical protein